MNTTTAIPPPRQSPKHLPESQRSTYQFPVYRWLSWLIVAGYGVGMALMFFLAGMVGLSAPLVWAFLVFVFCAGVALLGKPKALLAVMMFYFLLMPNDRVFGLVGVPLPGFVDELFFIPFLAVIVMYTIQKRHVEGGNWFALIWIGLAGLSWYANGKPSPFTTLQVTLVLLKFYIIWYYCRLTCKFDNMGQFWTWGKLYIYYAALQFPYNCLWQGRPWVTRHWDNSGGMFGPEGAGGAHMVGYISVLALFLLAAWWVGPGREATKRQKAWMVFLGAVITYDLVFMTDTKHALLIMPLAFLPMLFHRSLPIRFRVPLLVGGSIVALFGFVYISSTSSVLDFPRLWSRVARSPKGDAYAAVTRDFHYLVPYPLLGAGPGRFFSKQAENAGAPLARRYVIPYRDEDRRVALVHVKGSRTGGSMMGAPQCGVLTVMGEFGWFGMALYLGFIIWVFAMLWRKAGLAARIGGSAVCLCLGSGVLFLTGTMFVASTETTACLMFPWWMMVGRVWDMSLGESAVPEKTEPEGIPSP